MAETTTPVPPPSSAPRPPPTARRLPVGRIVIGVLLVGAGLLWLLDAVGAIHVSAAVVLPSALIAIGVVLVVISATGHRHGPLLAAGIVLTIILALASSFDVRLEGGVGQRVERPTTINRSATYRLSIGMMTIDLRGLQLSSGETNVIASVGIGQLVVQAPAPSGFTLVVRGRAGAGDVMLLGQDESGLGVDHMVIARHALPMSELVLDLRVGVGQIQVTR